MSYGISIINELCINEVWFALYFMHFYVYTILI